METAISEDRTGGTGGTGGEQAPQNQALGIIRGVPGESVRAMGVLDLRGCTSEELSKLKKATAVGTILIDSGQRAALSHVSLEAVGAVIEISAEERLLLQPNMEVGRAALESMSPGQRFTLIGVLTFATDAPAALVQEKFDFLRLIGVLIASEAVQGALFGRLDLTGVAITYRTGAGPLIRSMGDTRVTAGYLQHLQPDSSYINMGRTEIASEVTEELLASRIGEYHNLGVTVGPKALLELLQARCATAAGHFQPSEQ